MDKSMVALLSGFCIPPVLALAIHMAYKPKMNEIYKSSPLLRYINFAGIKVEKRPYSFEEKDQQ